MKKQGNSKIHILTILAGVLLAGILIALVVLLLQLSKQEELVEAPSPTASLTMIPAPTATSVITLPTRAASPTTTIPAVLPPGTIGVGAYVKVTGTEGVGLRMRAQASTSAEVLFMTMDEEVFLVIGGPEEKDGYTWWQLEAPYDKTRTGWSVDAYLTAIEQEEP
jgi:hypothetical protein